MGLPGNLEEPNLDGTIAIMFDILTPT